MTAKDGLTMNQLAERNAEHVTEIAALQAKCDVLAVENATLVSRMQQLIDVFDKTDNSYCMCGDAMESHRHGGCGSPTGMFDYHYSKWLESASVTQATDATLADVGAKAIEACAEALLSNDDISCEYEYPLMREFAAQMRKEAK